MAEKTTGNEITIEQVRGIFAQVMTDERPTSNTLIIAGSVNDPGAALLAAKSAYRTGSGVVQLGIPGSLHMAFLGALPEARWLILPHELGVVAEDASDVVAKNLDKITGLLIGPGLGAEETTWKFLRRLLTGKVGVNAKGHIGFMVSRKEETPTWNELPPLVMDGDGLRLLAQIPEWKQILPSSTVMLLTVNEMALLSGENEDDIWANPLKVVQKSAKEWNQFVVLKGPGMLLAAPSGRVEKVSDISFRQARAGTGSVLSGMVVSLCAQGMDSYEATAASLWISVQAELSALHRLGHPVAVMAGDILDSIPEVLKKIL